MILSQIERTAVNGGRASVRPAMNGVGYLEGLTLAERALIAGAHADVPGIADTPWDDRTKAAVRRTEAAALRAALAARPVATDPEPDDEHEPAVDWPNRADEDVYEPTTADRLWLASVDRVDLFSADRDFTEVDAFAASALNLPPIRGGAPGGRSEASRLGLIPYGLAAEIARTSSVGHHG